MTNLLHRIDKFVTIHSECSKTSRSTSTHYAARVRKSRVVGLSWSSRIFMRAEASKMRATNSSSLYTFVLQTPFFIQPHKQKSKA